MMPIVGTVVLLVVSIVGVSGMAVLTPAQAVALGPGSVIPKREIVPGVFMPDAVLGVGGMRCGEFIRANDRHDMAEVENIHAMIVNMTTWWAELGAVGFDTSTEYGSNNQLGRTLRNSNIRSDQFIVYKVDSARSPDWDVHNEISTALAELGVEKLGVAMIHEPQGLRTLEIWRELEKEVQTGRVQALGVSNFDEAHMREIMSISTVPIAVNQRQMNLKQRDDQVLEACNRLNATYQAYSPLGQGWHGVLQDPTVMRIAEMNQRTPAQIALKWILQRGATLALQSTSRQHMREDIDLWSWDLSNSDMEVLNMEVAAFS
mmetsp:Transcript_116/g.312  ORF Transcript_116/g.312 Transcript_116/m.312 type:complete len:318 (-) Transcript_116:87-1040(-)